MEKTIWLSGLSGSGKTTIANYLKEYLLTECAIIDGDDLRKTVNADLGFTVEDRNTNVRRAAQICRILNDNDVRVIACIMSPLDTQRLEAKEIIGQDDFFLVYVSCDLETLQKRDTKGLYAKYAAGEIKNMVGLDIPYQVPSEPNIVVNTAAFSVSECARIITTAYHKWILKKYTTHGNFDKIQSQRHK